MDAENVASDNALPNMPFLPLMTIWIIINCIDTDVYLHRQELIRQRTVLGEGDVEWVTCFP